MSPLPTDSDLVHEAKVVWLQDPEDLDCVRQALDKTRRRRSKPRYARDGRMIGSIELGADAEADPDSGLYRRRVFFLLPHDRDPHPEGVCKVLAERPPASAPSSPTASARTPRSQLGTSSAVAATRSSNRAEPSLPA